MCKKPRWSILFTSPKNLPFVSSPAQVSARISFSSPAHPIDLASAVSFFGRHRNAKCETAHNHREWNLFLLIPTSSPQAPTEHWGGRGGRGVFLVMPLGWPTSPAYANSTCAGLVSHTSQLGFLTICIKSERPDAPFLSVKTPPDPLTRGRTHSSPERSHTLARRRSLY